MSRLELGTSVNELRYNWDILGRYRSAPWAVITFPKGRPDLGALRFRAKTKAKAVEGAWRQARFLRSDFNVGVIHLSGKKHGPGYVHPWLHGGQTKGRKRRR